MSRLTKNSDTKYGFSKKVLFVLLALSVVLRVLFIHPYLIEAHGFRQTQTAITVQDWLNHGFDLLNYRTPVLGAPWTLPMEFPTFQATAYGLYHVLLPITDNLDTVVRMTSLIYFYLSVFAFSLLAKLLFKRLEKGALYYKIAFFIYLFAPFAIFWSKTSMIEYCAVFFQLLYVYCFLKLLYDTDRKKVLYFCGSLVFGGIGYLSKSTSMIPAVVFLFISSLQFYWPKLRKFKEQLLNRKEILKIVSLFLIAVLPFVAGIVWVRYSDNIKVQSGYSFLTSKGLESWNYGGLDVRLNLSSNAKLLKNLEEVLPMILLVISGVFLFASGSGRSAEEADSRKTKKQYCVALILAALVTAFTLFNLYSAHSYYSIAISPFLMLAGGFLYTDFIGYLIRSRKKLLLGVSAGLVLFHVCFTPLVRLQTWRPDHSQDGNVATGLWLKENSKEDDQLLIFNHEWVPVVPYYANRRALMVNDFLDQYDTLGETFSGYQYMVTGSSEEDLRNNAGAFDPPQTVLINTENGNNVFRIEQEALDVSQYRAGNGSFTVLLQKQNGIMIGNVVPEDAGAVKAVYCKTGDPWNPTWLNVDGSGKIRFALKTDLTEDTEARLAVLYENDMGEQFVSEISGAWQKD